MNDTDLTERLRQLDVSSPSQSLDPRTILSQGRRRLRWRRAGAAGAGAMTAAAAVTALVALPHGGPGGEAVISTPALASAPPPNSAPLAAAKLEPGAASKLDPGAMAHDSAILQRVLGPDFDLSAGGGKGDLREGRAAAVGLPEGYSATAMILAAYTGSRDTLESFCDHRCDPRQLPGGSTVSVLFQDGKPGHVSASTTHQVLRVMYQRPDGVLVVLQMNADDHSGVVSASRQLAVANWLNSYGVDKLGAVATDPDVEPVGTWGVSGSATPPPR